MRRRAARPSRTDPATGARRRRPAARSVAGRAAAGGLLLIGLATGCGGGHRRAGGPPSTAPTPTGMATSGRPVPATSIVATTVATTVAPTTTSSTLPPRLPSPAAVAPVATPPLPGEGRWSPVPASAARGGFGVYTTTLRPAGGYPAAGLAWINPRSARLALYAGSGEPYGLWSRQGSVAPSVQRLLIAAFNSGFKIYAYDTGWYADRRSAVPLRAGMASLVIFSDGTATVGAWGRDVTLSPAVEAVRQNLPLLVDGGRAAADVGVISDWGATLGGVIATWRSGVGVTPAGHLVYAGGPSLDPAGLARLLIAAGAVRAMELDINPEWVSFATYTHQGPAITGGTNLSPGMYFSPSHYLESDSRDFFAVFSR